MASREEREKAYRDRLIALRELERAEEELDALRDNYSFDEVGARKAKRKRRKARNRYVRIDHTITLQQAEAAISLADKIAFAALFFACAQALIAFCDYRKDDAPPAVCAPKVVCPGAMSDASTSQGAPDAP